MCRTALLALIAAVTWCIQSTLAAGSSYCPGNQNDVCFRWALPESTARSGSGDVYFQIEAPDTYQWVAMGIGSRMAGAKMFVIYQDGKGNVTLSTRAGTGHDMPEYEKRSKVDLIGGSGTHNSSLVANIRCGDCGSLDLSSSSSWIAAWKKGESLDSTDKSESIQEHDGHVIFTVDLAKSSTFSSGNPFVSSKTNNSSSGAVSGSSSSDGEGTSKAHGLIMALTFIIAYPFGAILMPMLGKWGFHASWQVFALFAMWAGFGLGYVAAKSDGSLHTKTHPKLGIAVCVLMTLQPILGWAHHKYFVKHQQRGLISHAHVWYGRILMSLGILNGGLGLQLANATRGYVIAYSIFSIAVSLIYVFGASIFESRRARRSKQVQSYQMTRAGEYSH